MELIEKREWYHYIFKKSNEEYEILVPISEPKPGFDVIYKLTKEELDDYLLNGICTLEDRIQDMRENYLNYMIVSWR
ncbi:MAG: hypothetical protein HWD89_14990 [Tenacibaculum sp.]|uniref:hypothetical protein n=1 Tax=Tenacibaculum sp. TaxID=1906242 RepID=UPI0018034309|nr:hypothetical protein [Tenacibaculum sp.]NVK10355.1 hypothetical protein [Tenacibaculum sp.]